MGGKHMTRLCINDDDSPIRVKRFMPFTEPRQFTVIIRFPVLTGDIIAVVIVYSEMHTTLFHTVPIWINTWYTQKVSNITSLCTHTTQKCMKMHENAHSNMDMDDSATSESELDATYEQKHKHHGANASYAHVLLTTLANGITNMMWFSRHYHVNVKI